MRSLEKLTEYLFRYHLIPHRWKGKGPGQVVLDAPEEDRDKFRQLKSDDIANFVDNELAAFETMGEDARRQWEFNRENQRLLRAFDREIEKHRKFTC